MKYQLIGESYMAIQNFVGKNNGIPLYLQLKRAFIDEIKAGKYENMQKLPSRRKLARTLNLSTTTINNAYQALVDEGYAVTIDRSGFYARTFESTNDEYNDIVWETSTEYSYNFSYNNCDTSFLEEYFIFPSEKYNKAIENTAQILSAHGNKRGEPGLRVELSKFLSQFRGISCSINDIIFGAGIQYLLTAIVMILGADKVYGFENPTDYKMYIWLKNLGVNIKFLNITAHNRILPDELDRLGIDVMILMPENQLPTGRRMGLEERQDLARWCSGSKDKYIIETATDGYLNYSDNIISTIYTLAESNVIYLESFEYIISPNIHASYMVLPPGIIDTVIKKLEIFSPLVTAYEQEIYHNLLSGGFLKKLILKNNKNMKKKRDHLISELKASEIGDRFAAVNTDTGMNFLGIIEGGGSGIEHTRAAFDAGVKIFEMSKFLNNPNPQIEHRAFVFGYGGLNIREIKDAVKRIERVWGPID